MNLETSYNYFLETCEIANEFMEAYIHKDIKNLEYLTTDNIDINNDNIILSVDGNKVKYDITGESYLLNGYGYENNTMNYYFKVNNKDEENGFFIHIFFKKQGNDWKVNDIEFDI